MTTEIQATCGRCIFWRGGLEEKGAKLIGQAPPGLCYGVPPTPYPIEIDKLGRILGQVNCRPMVRETETACGLFLDGETAKQLGAANN